MDPSLPRPQIVRLLLDQLNILGFSDAAKALERESEIQLEDEIWTKFRSSFLSGLWDSAETLSLQFGIQYEEDIRKIKFWIRRQKYLEMLEQKDVDKSLSILRNELVPLLIPSRSLPITSSPSILQSPPLSIQSDSKHFWFSPSELTRLSTCLIFARAGDQSLPLIKEYMHWPGSDNEGRTKSLIEIESLLPPSLSIVPHNRLSTLIHQALKYQQHRCEDQYEPSERQNVPLARSHFLVTSTSSPPPIQFSTGSSNRMAKEILAATSHRSNGTRNGFFSSSSSSIHSSPHQQSRWNHLHGPHQLPADINLFEDHFCHSSLLSPHHSDQGLNLIHNLIERRLWSMVGLWRPSESKKGSISQISISRLSSSSQYASTSLHNFNTPVPSGEKREDTSTDAGARLTQRNSTSVPFASLSSSTSFSSSHHQIRANQGRSKAEEDEYDTEIENDASLLSSDFDASPKKEQMLVVRWSPCGRYLATGSSSGTIFIHRLKKRASGPSSNESSSFIDSHWHSQGLDPTVEGEYELLMEWKLEYSTMVHLITKGAHSSENDQNDVLERSGEFGESSAMKGVEEEEEEEEEEKENSISVVSLDWAIIDGDDDQEDPYEDSTRAPKGSGGNENGKDEEMGRRPRRGSMNRRTPTTNTAATSSHSNGSTHCHAPNTTSVSPDSSHFLLLACYQTGVAVIEIKHSTQGGESMGTKGIQQQQNLNVEQNQHNHHHHGSLGLGGSSFTRPDHHSNESPSGHSNGSFGTVAPSHSIQSNGQRTEAHASSSQPPPTPPPSSSMDLDLPASSRSISNGSNPTPLHAPILPTPIPKPPSHTDPLDDDVGHPHCLSFQLIAFVNQLTPKTSTKVQNSESRTQERKVNETNDGHDDENDADEDDDDEEELVVVLGATHNGVEGGTQTAEHSGQANLQGHAESGEEITSRVAAGTSLLPTTSSGVSSTLSASQQGGTALLGSNRPSQSSYMQSSSSIPIPIHPAAPFPRHTLHQALPSGCVNWLTSARWLFPPATTGTTQSSGTRTSPSSLGTQMTSPFLSSSFRNSVSSLPSNPSSYNDENVKVAKNPRHFAFAGLDGRLRLVSLDRSIIYHQYATSSRESMNGEFGGQRLGSGPGGASDVGGGGIAPMPTRAMESSEDGRRDGTSSRLRLSSDGQHRPQQQQHHHRHHHRHPSSPIIKTWKFSPINDMVVTHSGYVITIEQAKRICLVDVEAWLGAHPNHRRRRRRKSGGIGSGSGSGLGLGLGSGSASASGGIQSSLLPPLHLSSPPSSPPLSLRRTAALTSPSSQAPGQQVPPPTHHAPSSSATSHQNAASTSRPIREGNPLVGRGLAATQRSFGNPTSNHTMSSSNHLTSSSNHPTSSPSNPVSYSATARPYLPPSLFLEHSLHLTSCSLSPDHTFLTVTTMASGAPFKALHHKQSIDIYDLRTMSLHATAQGLPQSSFVIRASLLHGFPGARSSGATGASGASGGFMLQSPSSLPDPPTSAPFMLLASGSEDSLVHLWDLSQGPNNGPFASSSSSKEQPGQAGGPPSSHSRPSVHSVPTSRRRIAPRIPSASSAGANGAIPTTGPQPFRLPSSHSSVVNDVDWHPKIPLLLASASDDHSVRLWCPH